MATTYNTGLVNVVSEYLKRTNIKATRRGLKKLLEENPYYPSLYSIKDTFDKFRIPNEGFAMDAEHFNELQPPFIAYSNRTQSGKDFILVTAITDSSVSFIGHSKKEQQVSKEEFLIGWQKIVLVAEPGADSIEPGYEETKKHEEKKSLTNKLLLLGSLALLSATIFYFFNTAGTVTTLSAGFILFTKIAGSGAALLLLAYETDKSNPFVKNICSLSKHTNCDAVLKSKAAQIAGIKWSEAGFYYFMGSFVFLIYPAFDLQQKVPWLAAGATLVSPYILFSLYYQYKVLKQWCPLCLAVQAVLLLELVWAIGFYWQSLSWPAFSSGFATTFLISILMPVLAWAAMKPLLKKAKSSGQYESAYKRLLYNPEYFNHLLQQQEQAPEGWQHLGIAIGNPAASNTIIKVCNPYCGPCAKAHPVLEDIIKNNSDFNLRIIFTATSKENDRAGKPVKHLLAIAEKYGLQQTHKALDDWYYAEKKDYDLFAASYPMNGELKQQDAKIDAMEKWCREAAITGTPTVYINGKLLPADYQISELKNIL